MELKIEVLLKVIEGLNYAPLGENAVQNDRIYADVFSASGVPHRR